MIRNTWPTTSLLPRPLYDCRQRYNSHYQSFSHWPTLIVIDEWKGRRLAKHAGLHVIGLVGVLLTAKRKGIVPEIGPILTKLADVAGFRLRPSLIN